MKVSRFFFFLIGLFCVALVISGTRTLHGESAASFGVEVVDRARPRWSRRSPRADAALARFVAERAPADDCTPVLVRATQLAMVFAVSHVGCPVLFCRAAAGQRPAPRQASVFAGVLAS